MEGSDAGGVVFFGVKRGEKSHVTTGGSLEKLKKFNESVIK